MNRIFTLFYKTQLQNEKKEKILLALTHNIAVIQSSSYTLKLESVPRITKFGQKMMVKSGLEKFVHINIPPMRKMVIFVTVILHKTPPF